MDISVIIPIFNEQENLSELCEEIIFSLKETKYSCEVIFIDDGSTDNSKNIILSYINSEYPFFKLIELNRNFGQNNAIFAGFRYCSGDLIFTMDGDRQVEFSYFWDLLPHLDKDTDIVCGIRKGKRASGFRKICSQLFNSAVNRFLKTELSDFGSMFRIHKRHVVKSLIECREYFLYTSILSSWLGFSVKEIEVDVIERKKGYSKYNIFCLVQLFFRILMRYSNIVFQWFLCANIIFSSLFTILILFFSYFNEYSLSYIFLLLASQFFFILFSMILFFAGEYVLRIYSDIQFNPGFIVRDLFEKK